MSKKFILFSLVGLLFFSSYLVSEETEETLVEDHLPVYGDYPYPVHWHWLVSVFDDEHRIKIEDGSRWEILESDFHILKNWRKEDPLVITPNYSWWNEYDYYITNKTNNSYVKANFSDDPEAFGHLSHWIVDIDPFLGHISLENQMVWCVDPQDSSVLRGWAVNDHVILGVYHSYFSSYDHILINVNWDNHVRVKRY